MNPHPQRVIIKRTRTPIKHHAMIDCSSPILQGQPMGSSHLTARKHMRHPMPLLGLIWASISSSSTPRWPNQTIWEMRFNVSPTDDSCELPTPTDDACELPSQQYFLPLLFLAALMVEYMDIH